jgi:hypothetical protein
MGNLFSFDLSNHHPSILRGSLLAGGDTVVACTFLLSQGEGLSRRNSRGSSRRNKIANERNGQATWLHKLAICARRVLQACGNFPFCGSFSITYGMQIL